MTQPESSPSAGSFFSRKVGPLPMWAWIGLAVGALLAVMGLRGKSSSTGGGQDQGATVPPNTDPIYVFQNYDQDRTYVTVPQAPPAGGRGQDPPGGGTYTPGDPPPVTQPKPPPPVVTPPPAPAGSWLTTVAYKSGQPKGTPSTLWGMAEQAYGNGSQWGRIWNAPQNASLKAQRGDPAKIRPGDRFWAPK